MRDFTGESAQRPAIACQQLPTDASVGDPVVRPCTRRRSAARFQLADTDNKAAALTPTTGNRPLPPLLFLRWFGSGFAVLAKRGQAQIVLI